ncbi:MAG: hypothetical protein HUU44_03030 [Ignavibacteriaceae bacterium]|nr:hypothetical protein [Ignavibacteriaceae bacterium]
MYRLKNGDPKIEARDFTIDRIIRALNISYEIKNGKVIEVENRRLIAVNHDPDEMRLFKEWVMKIDHIVANNLNSNDYELIRLLVCRCLKP